MNKRKVKKALESANKNSIPYVIIIGQNEIDTNTIELKDMNNSKSIKINLDEKTVYVNEESVEFTALEFKILV